MNLYTERELLKAIQYGRDYYDGWVMTEPEILKQLTPIELPSDEEIKEAVENKFGLVDPILGKSDYRMGYESGLIKGVKWMKKQILNQNK